MRGAYGERLVRGSAGALVGAALAVAAGCKTPFAGPYMCATGYDSCINPAQNSCETDTTTDGLNCGGCGMACAVGAPCLASSCGPAAVRIAQSGSSALVRTNASAVFWSGSNLSSTIDSLPLSAAAGATPAVVVNDAVGFGEGRAVFAVDDANLYYLANSSCPPVSCVDLVQASLTGGARTVLVASNALVTLLTNAGIPAGNGAGGNFRVSLALSGSFVALLFSQQMNNTTTFAVASAQIGMASQPGQLLAKGSSTNGPQVGDLAASSTTLAFVTWDNGNPSLRVVPPAGGSLRTLAPGGGFYGGGLGPLAIDESSVYTISSGCPCSDDNQSYSGPPPGIVARYPLDGSAPRTLASFWGSAGGVAIDSTTIYWSTDTAAWKVPLAGGMPVPVAGNLSNGVAAYQCIPGCGNNGGSQSGPTTIAIAPAAVYIAATGTEQAILKVAR